MKVSYDWLKEYVGDELPDVERVTELLTKHAFEIDDVAATDFGDVIDVDVLPNRASDCLCHRGIARELVTILDTSLAVDPLRESVDLSETKDITVDIEDSDACPRFTAALIKDIEVKESPEWLQKRLQALGQRPINNIVDATNYVMYAIGQPLHAYDADLFPQVAGAWQFQVRYARDGEQVSLIPEGSKAGASEQSDRVVACVGTELLIVDKSSDMPIGLAGVKGGRFAGVHAGTKNIIIEAAHFHPTITRKTARRLGIVIDASKRFENEPSRELPLYAQRDVATLIADIAGGTFHGVVDEYLQKPTETEVTVQFAKVNALLGLTLGADEIVSIIARTGATVKSESTDAVTVVGPWERTDLQIAEDFVEEVGRIHGLSDIESVVPKPVAVPELNARHYYSEQIRSVLLALGFSEVITSSFHKKGKIQLQNAQASDKSYVRGDLSKNLRAALDANFVHTDLLGLNDVRVFEIGTVFEKTEAGVGEHIRLALGVRQKGSGYTPKDDQLLADAQAVVADSLGVDLAWQVETGVAETNLSAVFPLLPKPTTYAEVTATTDVQFQSISPYPAVSRDIAMWVSDGVTVAQAEAVLAEHAGELHVRTTLFDEFAKDGQKSLAFRLVFQSSDRTLTDAEVNVVMDEIYYAVEARGWEVR